MRNPVALLLIVLIAAPVMAAAARDDQTVLARAAALRKAAAAQQPPEPVTPPTAGQVASPQDDLDRQEQEARGAALLAAARLDLVQARRELRAQRFEAAAQKADHALGLLRGLPEEVAGELELQAEGILARAGRGAAKPAAAPSAATEPAPPAAGERPAYRLRPGPRPTQFIPPPEGPRTVPAPPPVAPAAPPAAAPVEAESAPAMPAPEVPEVRETERHYLVRQGEIEAGVRASEVDALVDANASQHVPGDWVTYPPNWPEIVRKRARYASGQIARSASWFDRDGQEWYIGLYDIRDLTYVPPDFTAVEMDPRLAWRESLDREALRYQSYIFRGWAEDLALGIPLLRYFGGVDDFALRGPKYSPARQQQVVDLIRDFTNPPAAEAKVIPLAP